jgi:hypothetical protein
MEFVNDLFWILMEIASNNFGCLKFVIRIIKKKHARSNHFSCFNDNFENKLQTALSLVVPFNVLHFPGWAKIEDPNEYFNTQELPIIQIKALIQLYQCQF